MKTNAAINVIETNMTGQKNFSIKASAKAFKILSSGIYQNKIKAVIRETSTNAYDSHVAAGNTEVPFEVHMPSMFEPWFAVRDFGIGMDEAKIKKLYTTYFDSTKDQSNDFIGALGIGSKSPFSYTDNYTVTSWSGAEKRVYSCYIGEDGTPAIVRMGKEASDEKRGIEVRLAVKTEDFKKFQTEADEVYYWFDVLPIGLPSMKSYTKDAAEVYPGVYSFKTKEYETESLGVRMGQVYYPVVLSSEVYSVKHTIKYRGYTLSRTLGDLKSMNLFTRDSLVFKVNIGDVDMTASREDLEYTKVTVNTLSKLVGEYVNKSVQILIDGVLDAKSFDEAYYVRNLNLTLMNSLVPDLSWKGIGIGTKQAKLYNKFRYASGVKVFNLDKTVNAKPVKDPIYEMAGKVFVVIKDGPSINVFTKYAKYRTDNPSVFKHSLATKFKAFGAGAYINSQDDKYTSYYVMVEDARLKAKIVKTLDKAGIQYIFSSKLPALPAVAKSDAVEWEMDSYFCMDDKGHGITRSRSKADETKGGYYVNNADLSSSTVSRQVAPFFAMCKEVGYLPDATVLYSIPKRMYGNILNSPKWVDFGALQKSLEDKFINDFETIWKDEISDYLTKYRIDRAFTSRIVNVLAESSKEMAALNDSYDRYSSTVSNSTRKDIKQKLRAYVRIENVSADTIYNVEDDTSLSKFVNTDLLNRINTFVRANPLLDVISECYMQEDKMIKIVTPYLKGVL